MGSLSFIPFAKRIGANTHQHYQNLITEGHPPTTTNQNDSDIIRLRYSMTGYGVLLVIEGNGNE